ncbi:MAG: hypothetical protein HGA85_01100 [Nanoarchaeota archaeon]|nr:hypothetical protein [Nanoarchaeota archaeon]
MTIKSDEEAKFKELDERTSSLEQNADIKERIMGTGALVSVTVLSYTGLVQKSNRSDFKTEILNSMRRIDGWMPSVIAGSPVNIKSIRSEVKKIRDLRKNLSFPS